MHFCCDIFYTQLQSFPKFPKSGFFKDFDFRNLIIFRLDSQLTDVYFQPYLIFQDFSIFSESRYFNIQLYFLYPIVF